MTLSGFTPELNQVFHYMISKPVTPPKLLLFIFLLFIAIISVNNTTAHGAPTAAVQLFPMHSAIEKNVQFWENIYATYSLNDAVIHDSSDLSKIYEVVSLHAPDTPDATKLNKEILKQTKAKYSKLLKRLSTQQPASQQEKKIASLFLGSDKKRQMEAAATNIRSQRGQRERFIEGVIRSGSYITEMKRILKNYGLPEDLVYLSHVESSFNFRAYSKFGAAGIWQFTRGTGKQYLTINYSLDERLDPILATHAAAKYLKNSRRKLGNWPLAITSYNYGLAGMLRAEKEKTSYENIFKSYQKGHFKFAARNFYSEFLAALIVAKKLEIDLKDRINPPNKSRYLSLPGYIHIDTVCSHFNLSKSDLIKHNPALRKPVISGEKLIPKGYSLRLPAQKDTNTKIAALPRSTFRNSQLQSKQHRVQRGETAIGIAKKYGVSLKKLLKANNLDELATIFIKQKLRIPGQNISSADSHHTPVIKRTQSKTTGKISIPTLSTNKKRLPAEKESEYIPKKDPTVYNVFDLQTKNGIRVGYIVVQPEESLGQYAEWLNSDIKTIFALNNLVSDAAISPGEQLLLPFDHQSPTLFEDKRLDFLQETEEGFFSAFTVVGQKIYQVSDGDTFWDICYNKFEIPFWLLERYNSSINLQKLNRNQKLIIPLLQQI